MRAGNAAVDAFLSGYRSGPLVAAVLVAAGGAAAWLALRGAPQHQAEPGTQAQFALVG